VALVFSFPLVEVLGMLGVTSWGIYPMARFFFGFLDGFGGAVVFPFSVSLEWMSWEQI
jgi:hypothetical protein